MFKKLFLKKSIKEALSHKPDRSLKRSIGPTGLTLLGLGSIVGAGIFIVTGVASAKFAGPAIIVSFIVSAIACTFTALCYAEFASMLPISGSVYTYTYVTMGEIWAWMIGWVLIFEYLISASAVAVGWSSYVVELLNSIGINLPHMITGSIFVGGLINVPAVLIILTLTMILFIGAQESTRVNGAIVLINMAIIVIFIIFGLKFINPSNYHPFTPYGITGIFQGAAMVFFAYIGFDAVSTAAEETKDPQKNLPKGIIGSLLISSVLYIIVAAVLTGMVPYNLLDTAAPVTFALNYVGLDTIASIVGVGAIFGITSVLLTSLFGQTRIFFSMSRDGLLPGLFSKVHPRFRSPVTSILLVGFVASFIAALVPLTAIIELVNIGTLSGFIFLAISIIILRRQNPDLERGFKCPLVPAVPILSIISCIFLITQLSLKTIEYFIISLIIGFIVYMAYGFKNSKIQSTTKSVEAMEMESDTVLDTDIE
ncbi:MAG: amino acid permease [Methanobacterium sp. ERen5]|nr:MAG: amino acid permease [Methanobacterium sp. ERen5]